MDAALPTPVDEPGRAGTAPGFGRRFAAPDVFRIVTEGARAGGHGHGDEDAHGTDAGGPRRGVAL